MCQGYRLHEMNLPKKVIFGECWARDGLQNQTYIVPTEQKIEMINKMQEVGFTKMEVTNFAHPKILPQFADAEAVLKGVNRKPGVDFRAIVTNMNGMERAVKAKEEGYGVQEIALVISSTESHNMANVNMTHKENMALHEQITQKALDTGHDILAWVLTSFGCPIEGDVDIKKVIQMGNWWKSLGAKYIGFGDTTGSADPKYASYFYEKILEAGFTTDEVIVHFHDTRGWGVANSMVGLTYGFKYFDSSIGAIGGQPQTGAAVYHTGYAGNTCTEDLVMMFEEMGVDTGINIQGLIAMGHRAEEIAGRQLRSNVIHCGPVPHQGIIYDKATGIKQKGAS